MVEWIQHTAFACALAVAAVGIFVIY
jgi:hypothetical protein